jgi:hypothetical protein
LPFIALQRPEEISFMIARTTAVINKPSEEVWTILCDSQMDAHVPLLFRFGIPKPVECRLPSGAGGAG